MFIIQHDYRAIDLEQPRDLHCTRYQAYVIPAHDKEYRYRDRFSGLYRHLKILFAEMRRNQMRVLISLTACTTFPGHSLA